VDLLGGWEGEEEKEESRRDCCLDTISERSERSVLALGPRFPVLERLKGMTGIFDCLLHSVYFSAFSISALMTAESGL